MAALEMSDVTLTRQKWAAATARYRDAHRGSEEYRARRRAQFKSYYDRHKDRQNARVAVHRALKSGRLTKSINCQLCWDLDVVLQGHHQDHSKRLEVVWLCSSCHLFVDRHKHKTKEAL